MERLFDRGIRAAAEHVRRSPGYQETQRQSALAEPIVTTARLLARSPADDESLTRRMKAEFKHSEGIEFALKDLERRRSDFRDDRAYRILYAAARGVPVPAADPQQAENFRMQERLARLPLREAFSRLTELAPGLRDLEQKVMDGSWSEDWDEPDLGLDAYVSDRVPKVLGSSATTSPGVTSFVACLIAQMYLMISCGQFDQGDLDLPLIGYEEVHI